VNASTYVLAPAEGLMNGAYGRLDNLAEPDVLPAYLPNGAVVAIRPVPESTWAEVVVSVHQAVGQVVNAPVVLWTDLLDRRRTAVFATRARTLPAAAVIDTDIRSVAVLREALTDPWVWPNIVASWIEARLSSIDPEARSIIQQLAGLAAQHPTVRSLTGHRSRVARNWARAFERARIGTVGDWHGVLRSVAISLELQRHPVAVTADIAFRFGYLDPKSLRQRLRSMLGVRMPEIRTRLGGHWLLAEGLERRGILENGQICPH
jgi:hypothetical protein